MAGLPAPPEWDRLLSAAQKNKPDEIRRLVEEEGVDPSHSNAVGQSALHIAALWGHVEAVEVLLELGAGANAQNNITGASPLHLTVQSSKGSVESRRTCAEKLIAGGANPSLGDFYGSIPYEYCEEDEIREILKPETPQVFRALEEQNLEDLRRILREDPSASQARHMSNTPLLKLISDLVENEHEDTSLEERQLELMEALLEEGADPDAAHTVERNGHYESQEEPEDPPLHRICLAIKDAYRTDSPKAAVLQKAAKLLLDHGAKRIDETNQLLHDAARRNQLAMVKFLLQDLQLNVNTKGRQGMTPLQFAARSGKKDMVEFLLSIPGIDVDAQDDRGQTALDAARVNGKEEIAALLEQHSKVS